MKQGPLSFDDIPMQGGRIGAQHFRSPRLKVGYDGVHRYPTARNQNAGLSGRTEVGLKSALGQCACDAQGAVLLAERAIRTHGEESLPRAFTARSDGNVPWRNADIDEPAAQASRGLTQRRHIMKFGVHSADDVQARLQCFEQQRYPGFRYDTTIIGYADDDAACSARVSVLWG